MATRQEQIEFIRQAVVPAERVAARLGVPSNAVIAQWAMESGWGTSKLSKAANNFGGIKEWKNGPSVKMPTKETINGKVVDTEANFKKFNDFNHYADEYGNFLSGDRYKNVRGQKDPAGFVEALAKSGYATTNPADYSNSIIGAMKSVDRLLPEVKSVQKQSKQASNPPEDKQPGFNFKKGAAQMDGLTDSNTAMANAMVPNSQDATGDVIDWYKKNMPGGSSGGSQKEIEPDDLEKLLSAFAGTGASKADSAANQMLEEYANNLRKPSFNYAQPIKYKFPGYFNG